MSHSFVTFLCFKSDLLSDSSASLFHLFCIICFDEVSFDLLSLRGERTFVKFDATENRGRHGSRTFLVFYESFPMVWRCLCSTLPVLPAFDCPLYFEEGKEAKWPTKTPTVAPSFSCCFVLKIFFTFFCSFSIDVDVIEAIKFFSLLSLVRC